MKNFSSLKKNEWQAWAKNFQTFYPPWRPSTERIQIYRQLIKKYVKGNKILVLGATPEIRDMLTKMKFKVTLIDMSPMMVKAMTSLRKTKSKEKIIIHNWLTAKFKDRFDFIIGDSVVNNLHPKQINLFLRQLTKWLSKKGILILQNCVLCRPLPSIKISLDQIIKKLKYHPEYYHNYLNRAHDYQSYWYSTAKNHLNDLGKLEILFNQLYQRSALTKKEFSVMKMGFNSPSMISFYTDKEFQKMLKGYFKVLNTRQEQGHKVHKDFYKIYILTNK